MEKKRESGISKRSPSATKAPQCGTLKKSSSSRVDGAGEDTGKAHAVMKWTVVAVLIPKHMDPPLPDMPALTAQLAEMNILSKSQEKYLKNKEKAGASKTPLHNKNDKRPIAGRKMVNESENKLPIISRDNWKALAPKRKLNDRCSPFTLVVVNYIFLKHSISLNKCAAAIRQIQSDSMMHFDDILCHFVVGKNGLLYEGRGWDAEGEFKETINIAFTGNDLKDYPSSKEIMACKKLIQEGVKLRKIDKHYQLYTYPFHRLYKELMTWENFVPCC